MRNILAHINLLFALIFLISAGSAFGQSDIQLTISPVNVDNRAIDLGLSVYWADRNVEAQNVTEIGEYIRGFYYVFLVNGYPIDEWSDSQWPNWRVPTQNEAYSLISKYISFSNNVCTFSNNVNSIYVPTTAYRMGGSNGLKDVFSGSGYMFWTSNGTGSILGHIRDYYVVKYNNGTPGASTKLNYVNGLPVRPVIDKVTITVTTAGGKTITKTYPKGTKVRLSAYKDDCHKTHHWETNTNAPNINEATPEVTITSDITYTAFFERITYNASVSSNDEDMGNAQIVSTAEPDGKYKCGSIKMTATPTDDCHELIYWENGSGEKFYPNTNDENYTCTTNGAGVNTLEVPFHGDNTFTAYFSIKTTNIRATTDSNKGWVGLNVWK